MHIVSNIQEQSYFINNTMAIVWVCFYKIEEDGETDMDDLVFS